MKLNELYSAWKEKRGRKAKISVDLKNNISMNQISSVLLKWQVKKARLSETERFIELWYKEKRLWNILSDNYKIRQEKE